MRKIFAGMFLLITMISLMPEGNWKRSPSPMGTEKDVNNRLEFGEPLTTNKMKVVFKLRDGFSTGINDIRLIPEE